MNSEKVETAGKVIKRLSLLASPGQKSMVKGKAMTFNYLNLYIFFPIGKKVNILSILDVTDLFIGNDYWSSI
jgi:hypothetical protein